MVISLLVDKYIYKHRIISILAAESYLREVISYKALCSGDARSLQVFITYLLLASQFF